MGAVVDPDWALEFELTSTDEPRDRPKAPTAKAGVGDQISDLRGADQALTVFIAFPVGRLVELAVDGVPSGSVIGALAVELIIAALCLAAFRRRLWQPAPGLSMAQPTR